MRIGVFTSGGDAPGMNACIRAVVRSSHAAGVEVWGIRRGYAGLLEEDFYVSPVHLNCQMGVRSVSNIIHRGGTILRTSRSDEFQTQGIDKIVERISKRVGDNPLYLSIDIDVLDPAHAPGTGTPEIAGMTTREMVNVLRGLSGLNLISADVVEVSPAYDHAEVTSLAAATIVYELTNLFAKKKL